MHSQVSYSDPFGLCPVGRNPDYNVEDCPDNDIGASLRLLRSEGGDLGDMLIRHIADNRLKIRTSSRGRSKLRGDVITLQQRDNLGGMVGDLTHEVTHHILNVGLHPTAQEMVSWSVGLTVYEGLPSQYQQDAEYDRQSYIRSQNPLGWLGNVCRAAVRAYGGGSQFCF